ncbi:hypothetical protein [Clostridium sp. 'White wine YQ']|uniref:hypothetical protein n=1 Tax=Clostridium sp. 'White wine YQ' TaxID=3027474 RepID=UPI002366AF63|nr:hypothetical protein [Clostridium sp. 'White wine YQ']MDD7792715.1 hypothetical protein [Clostridium sp. 'White wine YQ']
MEEEKKNLKELNFAKNKINSWYAREGNKMLNIISRPYNSSILFSEIIFSLLKKNKKVVYIINGYDNNWELIEYIKEHLGDIRYSYVKKLNGTIENGVLYFINSSNIDVLKEEIELIIYDDITSFSNCSKLQITERIERIYRFTNKIIIYSIENVFNNIQKLELGGILNSYPMIEPRFITTRINLEEDIPYLLYEYFKWFKENGRRVVIHTPSKDTADKVYELYKNKISIFSDVTVIRFSEQDEIKKFEKRITNPKEPVMIITEYIGESLKTFGNIDVIVLKAHESRFDYKKIVFLCGKVGYRNCEFGEIILVANEITSSMEKAKEITRELNKLVWEKQ